MLWLKSLHLIFVFSWMAVLLYLPRLFVNYAEVDADNIRARLVLMMRRLLKLGHVAMTGSLVFGIWLLVWWSARVEDYLAQGWLHGKLLLIVFLIGYQILITRMSRQLAAGAKPRSSRWYRWFNELPSLAMIGIIILVVVKPF